MGSFLAIVGDTWRQSKQQIVFLLLIAAMGLFSVAWVLSCRVEVTRDGTYVLWLAFGGKVDGGFESLWDAQYKEVLSGDKAREKLRGPQRELRRADERASRAEQQLLVARVQEAAPELKQRMQTEFEAARQDFEAKKRSFQAVAKELDDSAQLAVETRSAGVSALDKGVQVWMSWGVMYLVWLTMFGFIAACSGYFPSMLAAGAVDVLVAKPVRRSEIFFGKYVGGLVLFTAALGFAFVVMFAGLGFKTGVWHLRFFAAMPVIVFSAALIYAIVAWVGIITRSTPLAIIVGYVYYVILEGVVWLLQGLDQQLSNADIESQWVSRLSEASRWVFPGFGRLNTAATAAVLDVPVFDSQPLLVGAGWLLLLLGTAYLWFRRLDF
ncbi:MAG: ABC transporter permease subunit [Polyangiaceae bacterium]|nr:ABC transporter permease subunit [Polyangiaceae bacterium]